MTEVEQLVVKIRLALDAERTRAVTALSAGVEDWPSYQYERGRADALKRAYDIVNDEADNLGRDE